MYQYRLSDFLPSPSNKYNYTLPAYPAQPFVSHFKTFCYLELFKKTPGVYFNPLNVSGVQALSACVAVRSLPQHTAVVGQLHRVNVGVGQVPFHVLIHKTIMSCLQRHFKDHLSIWTDPGGEFRLTSHLTSHEAPEFSCNTVLPLAHSYHIHRALVESNHL